MAARLAALEERLLSALAPARAGAAPGAVAAAAPSPAGGVAGDERMGAGGGAEADGAPGDGGALGCWDRTRGMGHGGEAAAKPAGPWSSLQAFFRV